MMASFPNMISWECWAPDNCFRCSHWPKTEDAPACPVEMAHMLYSYELCNSKDDPGKIILDMLIPPDGIGAGKCAMFSPRHGVTDKHLKTGKSTRRLWPRPPLMRRGTDDLSFSPVLALLARPGSRATEYVAVAVLGADGALSEMTNAFLTMPSRWSGQRREEPAWRLCPRCMDYFGNHPTRHARWCKAREIA